MDLKKLKSFGNISKDENVHFPLSLSVFLSLQFSIALSSSAGSGLSCPQTLFFKMPYKAVVSICICSSVATVSAPFAFIDHHGPASSSRGRSTAPEGIEQCFKEIYSPSLGDLLKALLAI